MFVAAIKARYGFDLKRFTDKNKEDRDTDDLQAKSGAAPDPDVQKLYALMAKIPSQRIKGKIDQMVVYGKDESRGVYYPDKRIYMAANRPGTVGGTWPDLNQESFNVEGRGDAARREGPVRAASRGTPRSGRRVRLRADARGRPRRGRRREVHGQSHRQDGTPGDKAFGAWSRESPKSIARIAAAHFGYDLDYICDTLDNKGNTPPKRKPKARGVDEDEWERRRVAALTWCRTIRSKASPWQSGAIVKQIAIGTRVYQEAYNDGRWYSYELAARSQGITAYQFRAPGEWFAELYAAHFANKLKPEHPAMAWLSAVQAARSRRAAMSVFVQSDWPARAAGEGVDFQAVASVNADRAPAAAAGDRRRDLPARGLPACGTTFRVSRASR